MITEDYVSFETAKLLKEKGFDDVCHAFYDKDGIFINLLQFVGNSNFKGVNEEKITFAPTLQMAIKWLREVHNITISITFEEDNRIYYELKKNGERKVGAATPLSYEDVCTEAINLCLKTLI